MFQKLCVLAIALAAVLNVDMACANFRFQNHSNETVTATVMTTEIFKDGHVNQFKNITLKPGQSHDFITNDVVPGRTVTLFIHSHNAGKPYFNNFALGKSWHWERQNGRILRAPYWSQPYSKRGNHYVAGQAAQGNYTPLMNSYPGGDMGHALQVVPFKGGHKAFQFTYLGFNQGFNTKSW